MGENKGDNEPLVLSPASGENNGWRTRVLNRSLQQAMQRSLERGAVFVEAAWQLMEERGAEGFTIQEISEQAGQSLRVFYQHFAGKDELFLAVLEELIERQVRTAKRDIKSYTDPVERLAALVLSTASLSGRPVSPLEVGLAKYRLRLLETDPERMALIQAPYASLVAELLGDAMEAGAIPMGNPEALAYFIVTLKSGYLRAFVLGNEQGLPTPSPVELARFCLQGIGVELPDRFAEDAGSRA